MTMRPSDVPTYVEAGAADLGITGKDVLAEQAEREVYELLDLGFGPCRMVFATVEGDDPAAEALRRLGVMRVATKYPKIAARYFERTGRQAEIVEVKGSVELAPLTGLVEGIVDLTATGTTLRENGLVIREEIARLDGAADRQSGRPQAEGGGDRPAGGAHPCGLSARCRTRPQVAARVRATVPAPGSVADDVAAIVADVRARGDDALHEYEARFSGNESRGGRADELAAALEALDPAVRAGLETAIANVRAVAEAGLDERGRGDAARGPDRAPARGPGAPRGRLRARRPAPVPVVGRHGRRHGPRGRRRRGRRGRARPPDPPRRRRAVRGRRGLPHGRRAGDRRAGVRHRDDPARRRHRRTRAACGCRRPSARSRASSASTASPARATSRSSRRKAPIPSRSGSTSSRRPSTARARSWSR